MKPEINAVWLKRDLRTQDHKPLWMAEQAGLPYMIWFVLEPSERLANDWSWRHWQFQYGAVLDMHKRLDGHPIQILYGEMTELESEWYRLKLGRDYPAPVCDMQKGSEEAKKALWNIRALPASGVEVRWIIQRHVNPKN
jgi:deoxyribodipyrimidine photolyase